MFDKYKKTSAFSLAEMMIVLFIVSMVLIALPPATKKLFKVKSSKSYHGRYECYWDNNKLKYYYVKERVGQSPLVEEGEVNGEKCEFMPPVTYPYIIIHAVGGGGAGGNLTTAVANPSMETYYEEYHLGEEEKWTKWFGLFYNKITKDSNLRTLKEQYKIQTSPDKKDVYSATLTTKVLDLQYRKSGSAGEIQSTFFPYIPEGNRFYLYPGKGGELQVETSDGGDGSASVVQVIKSDNDVCDKDDRNALCNIVYAQGGRGAIVTNSDGDVINLVSNVQFISGKKYDYETSIRDDVKIKESGFSSLIDSLNESDDQVDEVNTSRIPSNAGNGGNGGNHYSKNAENGIIYHEFDDFKINPDDDENAVPNMKLGGNQGVEWIPVSKYVTASNIGSACTNKENSNLSANADMAGTGFWITRKGVNDISTQCFSSKTKYSSTDNPKYFYCTVGYMHRYFTANEDYENNNKIMQNCYDACDDNSKGPCACYAYEYNGSEYVLYTPVSGEKVTVSSNIGEDTDSENSSEQTVDVENTVPTSYGCVKRLKDSYNYSDAVDACKAVSSSLLPSFNGNVIDAFHSNVDEKTISYNTYVKTKYLPNFTYWVNDINYNNQISTFIWNCKQQTISFNGVQIPLNGGAYTCSGSLGSYKNASDTYRVLCYNSSDTDCSSDSMNSAASSSSSDASTTITAVNPIHNYHSNFENKTDITSIYKDPVIKYQSYYDASGKFQYSALFTIKEHISDNAPHIFCTADNSDPGYKTASGVSTPCASGAEYDASKGVCKATKGGNGAIVILW